MVLRKLERRNHGGKWPMSIKYQNLHSFKEGLILLCQSPWNEKNNIFTWLSSHYNPFNWILWIFFIFSSGLNVCDFKSLWVKNWVSNVLLKVSVHLIIPVFGLYLISTSPTTQDYFEVNHCKVILLHSIDG